MNMLGHFKKPFIAGLLVSCIAASPVSANDGLKDNKVVVDSNGNVIRSIKHGTCVRTQWETKNDINPCAAKVEKVAEVKKPVPAPARTLKKEERTIYFDFDKSNLDSSSQQKLDHMAKALTNSVGVRSASIVGYADKIGNAQYNENLSKQRAASVKDYLAKRGYFNTSIAKVRGFGEENPVKLCDEKTRSDLIACLRPNRRVEVEVDYIEESNQ